MRGDVDIDEPHVRVLECGLGGGGEIAEARADGDHQVGLARGDVGAGRPGHADGAQVLRMVEAQRALAGLRLADGNSGALAKPSQRLARLRCTARRRRPRSSGRRAARMASAARANHGRLGLRPGNAPDPLLKHLFRVVPGFGLHVLRKRQRHRAGFATARSARAWLPPRRRAVGRGG